MSDGVIDTNRIILLYNQYEKWLREKERGFETMKPEFEMSARAIGGKINVCGLSDMLTSYHYDKTIMFDLFPELDDVNRVTFCEALGFWFDDSRCLFQYFDKGFEDGALVSKRLMADVIALPKNGEYYLELPNVVYDMDSDYEFIMRGLFFVGDAPVNIPIPTFKFAQAKFKFAYDGKYVSLVEFGIEHEHGYSNDQVTSFPQSRLELTNSPFEIPSYEDKWDDDHPDITEDHVSSPDHYKSDKHFGTLECKDWIQELLTKEEYEGWLKGSALKYIWRYQDKGNPKQDLAKAGQFISFLSDFQDVKADEEAFWGECEDILHIAEKMND